MTGPWTKYQSESSGPWSKYQEPLPSTPMSTSDAVSALDVINQPVQPQDPVSKPYRFDPLKRIYGAAEAATTIASSIPATLAGNVIGAVSGAFGKDPNRVREEVSGAITYSPRSEYGKAIIGDVGKFIESDVGKLIQGLPVAGQELPMLAQAARQVKPAMEMRGAEKALKASEEGWANSARIEAAQSARKLGLTVPSDTVVEKLIGQSSMSEALAKANAPKIQQLVKRDLGLPKNAVLSNDTYKAALADAGQARNVIRGIDSFTDDGSTVAKVRNLAPKELIGNEAASRKVGKIIASAEEKISAGMSGDEIVESISQLRKDASLIRKMQNPGPVKAAKADAMMGIANALEDMVESNLAKDPTQATTLKAFREGREKMAKIYMYKNATDMNTNTVDPIVIAKLTAKDNAITGIGADIGKIAGVFPEAAGVAPTVAESFMKRHASRFGPSGLAGGAVGAIFGNPVAGAVIGGAAGEIAAPYIARKIAESGRRSSYANDPRLKSFERIGIPERAELSLAPIGAPIQSQIQQGMPPQTRGLLSLSEENVGAGRTANIPAIDYPVEPRLNPLFQRGGVPQEPRLPSSFGSARLPEMPPELPPILPSVGRASEQYPLVSPVGLSSIAERYQGTNMPIGLVEGGGPASSRTPFPQLPYEGRGLLSIADEYNPIPDTQRLATRHDVPTMEFKLRAEVLNQPEIKSAIQNFVSEAERLRNLAKKSGGFWQSRYQSELAKLENEFLAGMKQLGIRSREEALGLVKLYESKTGTRLPIERGFNQ